MLNLVPLAGEQVSDLEIKPLNLNLNLNLMNKRVKKFSLNYQEFGQNPCFTPSFLENFPKVIVHVKKYSHVVLYIFQKLLTQL